MKFIFLTSFISIALPAMLFAESNEIISLESQWGEVLTTESFKGNPFLLIIADRKGSEFTKKYMTNIIEFRQSNNVLSIAVLGDYPKFIQGIIKKGFQKHRTFGMDWGSRYASRFDYQKGKAYYIHFDADHRVKEILVSSFQESALLKLLDRITRGRKRDK